MDVNMEPQDVQALLDFLYPPEPHNALTQREGGIVEMVGGRVSRDGIAPESNSVPHRQGYNRFESIPPPVYAVCVDEPNHISRYTDHGPYKECTVDEIEQIKRRQGARICSARDHAVIEMARRFKWDLTYEYRKKVEEKLEPKIQKYGKSRRGQSAVEAEACVADQYMKNKLGPAEKLEVQRQMDNIIGIILNEPDWKRRRRSLSWVPSVRIKNMERTCVPDDWVNGMICKLVRRCEEANSRKQAQQV
jgi:hypothetical protein